MEFGKIAVVSLPEINVDTTFRKHMLKDIFKKMVNIGFQMVLFLYFTEDAEVEYEYMNEYTQFMQFTDKIAITGNNIYASAFDLTVKLAEYFTGNEDRAIYFINYIKDYRIIPIYELVIYSLGQYLATQTANRRQKYPRYNLIRLLWDQHIFYEYAIPIFQFPMQYLHALSDALSINATAYAPKYETIERNIYKKRGITNAKLHENIEAIYQEDAISIASVKDYTTLLKKAFFGYSGFADEGTSGFTILTPLYRPYYND